MTRRIAITGGAGTLATTLTPMLSDDGWTVRLADVRQPEVEADERMTADLRRADGARAAVDGCEAVIHAAAWHGIHLSDHAARDFWELNVDGTYNVLEAAVDAGVERVVLSSTMGVYGASGRPDGGGPAVRVHEALPLLPGDIYGHSKVAAESLAAYFERAHGLRTIALRYGMFVPEPFEHYGIRMLYGGVDVRDVASANVAALRRMESSGTFGAYNVFSRLPFEDADLVALRSDPMEAVRRHWPDGPDLLERTGARPWGPVDTVYDSGLAERDLGWLPRYNFDQFLDGLRRGASSADDLIPAP